MESSSEAGGRPTTLNRLQQVATYVGNIFHRFRRTTQQRWRRYNIRRSRKPNNYSPSVSQTGDQNAENCRKHRKKQRCEHALNFSFFFLFRFGVNYIHIYIF